MRRNTPPDRLSRDAAAARAVGQSYGMWKANHPHTSEDPEPETGGEGRERVCPQCGRKFVPPFTGTNRKYCDDLCRQRASNERQRSFSPKDFAGECQVCGRPINATHGRKYCGKSCQDQANRERAKLRSRRIYAEKKENT